MKKFNQHILVILLLFATAYGVSAQGIPRNSFRPANPRGNQRFNQMPNPSGMQKIQAVKENFLDQKLQLTSDEAGRFWPLYRKYQDEVIEVRRLKRLNNSDAQANGREQVKKDLEYDGRLVEIKTRYNQEFLKILPPEKLSQLYKSEREFNDELIRKINEQ
ncbi:hypothetical protein ACFQZS_14935 [Mucilaginibacter calamicampi]|uniref:LTXXQ motif family protein n=1 Tax=Mucilaginibacter calamicampi TaxID=1302352 RepID=A0ABW2YYY8_9SPHI